MNTKIFRNLGVNVVGSILPTFISLVTVPLYIKYVGVERYGVIALVWALIGYFSILDFGMSLATENRISRVRLSDPSQIPEVFWSGIWFNLATGIVGGIVVYVGIHGYVRFGDIKSVQLAHEVLSASLWLAVAIPAANVSWVAAGALGAAERFDIYNINQTVGTMFFQVLPLVAAIWWSPVLGIVLPIAVTVRIINGAMLCWNAAKVLEVRTVMKPSFATSKGLYSYGGWMATASAIGTLTDSLDRVFIGMIGSAKLVAYYTVPQNLVQRMNIIPSALLRTLFPRLSASSAEEAAKLSADSLEFLAALLTPAFVIAIFIFHEFLNLWVGPVFGRISAPVAEILVIAIWVVGQSNVLKILLQAQMKPRVVTRLSAIQLPFYALLLWFAIDKFGLAAAAVVVGARATVEYGVLLWLTGLPKARLLADFFTHLAILLASVIAALLTQRAVVLAALVGTAFFLCSAAWSLIRSAFLRSLFIGVFAKLRKHLHAA